METKRTRVRSGVVEVGTKKRKIRALVRALLLGRLVSSITSVVAPRFKEKREKKGKTARMLDIILLLMKVV